MTNTTEKIVNRLIDSRRAVETYFSQQPDEFWASTIYTDGAHWNSHQILAHFVEAEISINRLVDNILSGGEGSPEDFDLNAYNERHVARVQNLSTDVLLLSYQAGREKTIEKVRNLTEADLAKPGRHPVLGQTTVGEILKLLATHNLIHIREMRAALKH